MAVFFIDEEKTVKTILLFALVDVILVLSYGLAYIINLTKKAFPAWKP